MSKTRATLILACITQDVQSVRSLMSFHGCCTSSVFSRRKVDPGVLRGSAHVACCSARTGTLHSAHRKRDTAICLIGRMQQMMHATRWRSVSLTALDALRRVFWQYSSRPHMHALQWGAINRTCYIINTSLHHQNSMETIFYVLLQQREMLGISCDATNFSETFPR